MGHQPVADVRTFLSGLPAGTVRIAKALRRLVLAAAPGTRESIVWGSLSYHRPELGGRVKGAVCLITPRADHVELGFIHGVLLADPEHLLEGERRSKRVVRITAVPDPAQAAMLEALVRAAAVTRPPVRQG